MKTGVSKISKALKPCDRCSKCERDRLIRAKRVEKEKQAEASDQHRLGNACIQIRTLRYGDRAFDITGRI